MSKPEGRPETDLEVQRTRCRSRAYKPADAKRQCGPTVFRVGNKLVRQRAPALFIACTKTIISCGAQFGIARARTFYRYFAEPILVPLPNGEFQLSSWSAPRWAWSSNAWLSEQSASCGLRSCRQVPALRERHCRVVLSRDRSQVRSLWRPGWGPARLRVKRISPFQSSIGAAIETYPLRSDRTIGGRRRSET